MGEKLKIRMLGSFEMSLGDCLISEKINNSKKMWCFLKYIITYKDNPVQQADLIEVLWPEENSKDPYNALKNLLYRLRLILEENNLPNARRLIFLKNNNFIWNHNINCEFDFLEFERLMQELVKDRNSDDERISICEKALALYRGDFLPAHAYDLWAMPVNTYYHSLYIKLINEMIGLYEKKLMYEEIIKICEGAIKIDRFEESFYISMIQAYLKLGKNKLALMQYEKTIDLFYNQLGINTSMHFKSLYRDIVHTEKDAQWNIHAIIEDLREQSERKGAFVCEYEFFKDIYRLEERVLERTGQSAFLALLTLTGREEEAPNLKFLASTMENLLEIAMKSLRKGDVISRFSRFQYIILLPSLTYENGIQVMDRIVKNFKRSFPKKKICLHYALQPPQSDSRKPEGMQNDTK